MPATHDEGDSVKGEVPKAWGPERRGWHFDRTWSASDLVIVIMTLVGGIGAYYSLKQDDAVQATQIQYIERQRLEDRAATERALVDVNARLMRIDDKLEKIAERLGAK